MKIFPVGCFSSMNLKRALAMLSVAPWLPATPPCVQCVVSARAVLVVRRSGCVALLLLSSTTHSGATSLQHAAYSRALARRRIELNESKPKLF
mmetsp:Transcript_22723/g.58492  ORF Transcript_22723/g.58492 Transcript_22723/m.58492 type:complete len:93 (+) Transcript_22723:26-304(+)